MLFALVLAASPVDVEAMGLEELKVEEVRLELTPSTVAPWTMVGVGLGLSASSFGTVGAALYQLGKLSRGGGGRGLLSADVFAVSVEIIAVAHGVCAVGTLIAGVLWLPPRANAIELAGLQRARVRERITELEASGATYEQARVAARQAELFTAAEPSYALPGNLMFGGCLSFATGVASLALFHGSGEASLAAGIAETAAGVGLIAVASWLFYRYAHERDWLRARREAALTTW